MIVKDEARGKLVRVDTAKFGEYLEHLRKDTPSPDDPNRGLYLGELAEMINADLPPKSRARDARNEEPITPAIIRRIELDRNKYWGHFMRICQICRALKLRIVVGPRHGKTGMKLVG